MKKLALFFLVAIMAVGCISKTEHQKQITATRDSLTAVVGDRDNEIVNFLLGFNEIQQNLDSIKQLEKMVTLETSSKELSLSDKDQIIEDVNRLYKLLEKNKKLVADLKSQQGRNNSKIKELQETIILLEKQMFEKDGEIALLNDRIAALNIDVSNLRTTVTQLSAESERKSQELLDKEIEANRAWYAFGTDKELIANNIIDKSGGFLGLGKSMSVTKKIDTEYFQLVDVRTFFSVPLNVKKAKLLSVHPEGSFHFEGTEKSVESLEIDDAAKFWSITRYMVIVVE
jgi:chromosome segregation ATPase